jgi:tetratricopeptide (TPR) repeat protein
VEQFSEDLEAFLESRPVKARSGNTWYRTRKFLRRSWLPVAAGALVIASLSTGLYIANRERLVAERRFGQLRQLSGKVFDLDKSIRDLPGSTQARQNLGAASLEYLEGLSGSAREDLDLAREIGQGYWRVGRIQGVPVELNLGERAKAEASLKKAAEFIERVLAARAKDQSALYLSGVIAHDRMILATEEHRYADALAHAHESARELDAYLRFGNARPAERAEIAVRYGNIAVEQMNMHYYEEAIRHARREMEIAESIPSARIAVDAFLISVADAVRQADLAGALQALEKAREATERAVFPSEGMRSNELYRILSWEGLILGGDGAVNLGRPADAIQALQKALGLAEDAAREDPTDAMNRLRAAEAGIALADILRQRDARQALSMYDVSLRWLSEIHNSLPAQRDRASALADSSYPLRRLGRASEARQRIDAALAILRETQDYPAEQYYFDGASYGVLCALADHEAQTGAQRLAIETYESLFEKVPGAKSAALIGFEDAPRASRLFEALGGLYARTGDGAKAESMRARRIELWQSCDRKFPNNAFVRQQIETARHSVSHYLSANSSFRYRFPI